MKNMVHRNIVLILIFLKNTFPFFTALPIGDPVSMASTSGVNIGTGLDNQRHMPVELEAQDSISNHCNRKQLSITNYIPKKMSVDTQKKLDHSFLKLFTKDL